MKDPKQHARDALQAVIDRATNQTELARSLAEHTGRPIATGHVHYWLSSGAIPTDICVAIEALFEGAKREDLRPADYWKHWPDLKAPAKVKPSGRPAEEAAEAKAGV